MYDVLTGIRVVEVASFILVPVAGAVLADWGADVIKVEPPATGDPFRGLRNDWVQPGLPNPFLQIPNRGKRSVGIDLTSAEGLDVLDLLLVNADVLLTSLRLPALHRLGLDWQTVHAKHPHLVYGRGSGYGSKGPDADKPAFDPAATWARAGFIVRTTDPAADSPTTMPGSIGDLSGGMNLAAGVSAALLKRDRTGTGVQVDVSLYQTGMWMLGQSIAAASLGLDVDPVGQRTAPRNALANTYRTSDGRWLILCMMQSDRYWQDFCEHVGRPDLVRNPRFSAIDVRDANAVELVGILDETFGAHDLATWTERLSTMEGPWSPALSPSEVLSDPQVQANDYIGPLADAGDHPNASEFKIVPSPVQFDGRGVGEIRSMPEVGQQTEEVLLELGLVWDEIIRLKELGAIT